MVATPLVGSDMYKICIDKNYIKNNAAGGDFKNAVINTEDFTAEYIEQTAYFLNLELNFVENNDFKLGLYSKALAQFKSVIKIKDDHAFAYYFAAKCYKNLGLVNEYQAYKDKYENLIKQSAFWKRYVDLFKLA